MELNREQIVKALECCSKHPPRCRACPYQGMPCCTNEHRKDALTLIKQLTADVERVSKQCGEIIVECDERDAERLKEVADWKAIAKGYQKQFEDCAEDRAKLTEENERLQVQADMWKSTAYCEKDRCNTIEVATVLKMRSEIERRCIEGGIYPAFVKSVINNVAEEMVKPI